MPYGDPAATDPMELVGVELSASEEASVEMAYAFAEEFARSGFSEVRIMSLFRTPFYRAAHAAHRALGGEAIQRIVRECVGVFGRVKLTAEDRPEAPDLIAIEGAEPARREERW